MNPKNLVLFLKRMHLISSILVLFIKYGVLKCVLDKEIEYGVHDYVLDKKETKRL